VRPGDRVARGDVVPHVAVDRLDRVREPRTASRAPVRLVAGPATTTVRSGRPAPCVVDVVGAVASSAPPRIATPAERRARRPRRRTARPAPAEPLDGRLDPGGAPWGRSTSPGGRGPAWSSPADRGPRREEPHRQPRQVQLRHPPDPAIITTRERTTSHGRRYRPAGSTAAGPLGRGVAVEVERDLVEQFVRPAVLAGPSNCDATVSSRSRNRGFRDSILGAAASQSTPGAGGGRAAGGSARRDEQRRRQQRPRTRRRSAGTGRRGRTRAGREEERGRAPPRARRPAAGGGGRSLGGRRDVRWRTERSLMAAGVL
jgi:hypothetical protein